MLNVCVYMSMKESRFVYSYQAMSAVCMFVFLCNRHTLSLGQGNCPRVSSINDKNGWKVVRNALTIIGFHEEEIQVSRTHTHILWTLNLLSQSGHTLTQSLSSVGADGDCGQCFTSG